jgi:hypothetical protein
MMDFWSLPAKVSEAFAAALGRSPQVGNKPVLGPAATVAEEKGVNTDSARGGRAQQVMATYL